MDNDQFEKLVKKCAFGIVPTLTELFTEFAYCKAPAPHRNSDPAGMYFFSGRDCGVESFIAAESRGGHGPHLLARPVEKVQQAMWPRCLEGKIGSFELIKWELNGHALLMGTDSTMIAQVWLALIPLEGVTPINPGNTPRIV